MVAQIGSSSSSGNFPQPSLTADVNNDVDYLFPEMLIRYRVNHLGQAKTVDIDLKLGNVKVDEIDAALDRLIAYLKAGIAQDMNPGVTPPSGTVFQ